MNTRDQTEERHGIRLGMPVRDLDGKSLGRVTDLYDDGFHVLGGLPIHQFALGLGSFRPRQHDHRQASGRLVGP
jgi:hypothetical protein